MVDLTDADIVNVIKAERKAAADAERERCVRIVRQICGEVRHVTLGDAIERELLRSA